MVISPKALQLHSNQRFQYPHKHTLTIFNLNGITPSMSRHGNCYDDAMAENFFSILKTECIYRVNPKSFDEARRLIDEYIWFYNHERIQLKSKLAPLDMRRQFIL